MARKNQKAPWEEEEEIIWVSKTEMKEDMEALQKLGERTSGTKAFCIGEIPATR
ncbi:putative alpha helix protein [Vibrio ishigakensis]|uniref:Putative alpha helix protein n=1 Tax=Vibrio ishigakensis TaxID=1481914 RepID=A0A0B8PE16_9VIBR|nr:putative alpha helix protein [Vibrio ishigakensis]